MTAKEIIQASITANKSCLRSVWPYRNNQPYNRDIIREGISVIRELQRCLNYLNNVTFKNK